MVLAWNGGSHRERYLEDVCTSEMSNDISLVRQCCLSREKGEGIFINVKIEKFIQKYIYIYINISRFQLLNFSSFNITLFQFDLIVFNSIKLLVNICQKDVTDNIGCEYFCLFCFLK